MIVKEIIKFRVADTIKRHCQCLSIRTNCSRSLHQSLRVSSTLGDWFGALVAAKRANALLFLLFHFFSVIRCNLAFTIKYSLDRTWANLEQWFKIIFVLRRVSPYFIRSRPTPLRKKNNMLVIFFRH